MIKLKLFFAPAGKNNMCVLAGFLLLFTFLNKAHAQIFLNNEQLKKSLNAEINAYFRICTTVANISCDSANAVVTDIEAITNGVFSDDAIIDVSSLTNKTVHRPYLTYFYKLSKLCKLYYKKVKISSADVNILYNTLSRQENIYSVDVKVQQQFYAEKISGGSYCDITTKTFKIAITKSFDFYIIQIKKVEVNATTACDHKI